MSVPNESREHPDGRQVRYAVVEAGWISQEDFVPGVEQTGNSVMTGLVTGDQTKAKARGRSRGDLNGRNRGALPRLRGRLGGNGNFFFAS